MWWQPDFDSIFEPSNVEDILWTFNQIHVEEDEYFSPAHDWIVLSP